MIQRFLSINASYLCCTRILTSKVRKRSLSRIRTVEMKTLRYLVFCPDSWSLGSHVLNWLNVLRFTNNGMIVHNRLSQSILSGGSYSLSTSIPTLRWADMHLVRWPHSILSAPRRKRQWLQFSNKKKTFRLLLYPEFRESLGYYQLILERDKAVFNSESKLK